MSAPLTLDDKTVEAIAERVAEMLRDEPAAVDLLDAAQVARRFNVSRDYVYEHAEELGAVRLGTGPKARLRFDPERVVEALAPRALPAKEAVARRRPHRPTASVDLLPIGRRV